MYTFNPSVRENRRQNRLVTSDTIRTLEGKSAVERCDGGAHELRAFRPQKKAHPKQKVDGKGSAYNLYKLIKSSGGEFQESMAATTARLPEMKSMACEALRDRERRTRAYAWKIGELRYY